MKKIAVLLLALMPVFILSSCDGEKKNKNVQHLMAYSFVSDEDGSEELIKTYTWNGDQIQQTIEYMGDEEPGFICDYTWENGRVVNMTESISEEMMELYGMDESPRDSYNFVYEGEKLIRIENSYNGEPYINLNYRYNGNNVSEIGIELAVAYKAKTAPRPEHRSLSNGLMRKIDALVARTAKSGKAVEDELARFTYKWDGKNPVEMVYYELNDEGEMEQIAAHKYAYDKAVNPFFGILQFNSFTYIYGDDYRNMGANNPVDLVFEEGGEPEHFQYTYTYDSKNYPTSYSDASWGGKYVLEYHEN